MLSSQYSRESENDVFSQKEYDRQQPKNSL